MEKPGERLAMKRIALMGAALVGMLALPGAAGASGDYGCYPSWKLGKQGFSNCDNRAVLSPGNDTRVNLFFLLRDQQRASVAGLSYPADSNDLTLGRNFFYWGDLRKAFYPSAPEEGEGGDFAGSRCISLASGAQAFGDAMRANRALPTAERDKLAGARSELVKRCNAGDAAASWPEGVKSTPGREFLSYLQAAEAFYGALWAPSRQGFERLRAARDPWLAETAAYMLARVELNAAQDKSFDEYGSFAGAEQVDKAALVQARAGLDSYLRRYPKGRYAASAQGLVRRAMWLAGDVEGLAHEYERLFAATPAGQVGAFDLIQEVDNKLPVFDDKTRVDGPLLLAILDLKLMRSDSPYPTITVAQIDTQKARFAGREDLFGFIAANHAFYVAKDMRRVLELIPDDARRGDYAALAFSRQVLRGQALAALKDRNEAGFWRELLGGAKGLYQRPAVELALAMNYERSGKLAGVFAGGSPIGETSIREILLQYVAGPDILRAQAVDAARPQHERDVALFTLLTKQLGYGNYAGFLKDSATVRRDVPEEGSLWNLQEVERIPLGIFRAGRSSDGDYACPSLSASVSVLARNSRDVRARLCLGEFYRLSGFDGADRYEVRPKPDELGGTTSLFPGKSTARGDIYRDVMADPRAAANDQAYALHRAVNCYAPVGNNQCGGAEVAKSQRQAWFQRLKREFPNSGWTRKLRYYW
jgi:hypothetical protein